MKKNDVCSSVHHLIALRPSFIRYHRKFSRFAILEIESTSGRSNAADMLCVMLFCAVSPPWALNSHKKVWDQHVRHWRSNFASSSYRRSHGYKAVQRYCSVPVRSLSPLYRLRLGVPTAPHPFNRQTVCRTVCRSSHRSRHGL